MQERQILRLLAQDDIESVDKVETRKLIGNTLVRQKQCKWLWVILAITWIGQVSLALAPPQAQAVPAFARKYSVNCSICHTRPPRLNPFGERFLENGYQLPGTEDGGIIGKRRLGDLTLDDVSNYLAFRLRGNVFRNFDYNRQSPGPGIAGNPEDRTELAFPEVFSLFTTGTLTHNVGFFVELETNLEEEETEVERGFITLNNLGKHDLAHLRLGRFDPSAYFSHPTLRQQLELVGDNSINNGKFLNPTINRISLTPLAFGAKFYGLFDHAGKAILPFQPSLYNAVAEMGIDLHGRPFGDQFLYQIGVLNGANEPFGDSNNPKDWYVMVRLDQSTTDLFSASLSGFAYFGSNNAKVALNQADVNWNRYGMAGTLRYKMVDLYGTFTIDRVTNLPQSLEATFDATATGTTVEADVLVTDRLLLSLRYDHLDAGGNFSQRKSYSILAAQAKYYLRTNISIYIRDDFNLREAEGGLSASRNFRNALLIGADLVY